MVLNASNEASEADYKTASTTNPKWGQVGDVHGKLVSTETKENAAFWELQQKDLFGNIDTDHAFFTAKKDSGVKEACKAAYAATKADTSTTTSPSQVEILKYCSLKGQA